jgi:FMN phosphatase YigB (HAD superfamily)
LEKTILFDLDGTLLPLEMEEFLEAYIYSISSFCAKLINPELFIPHLLESTEKMVRNDGKMTNEKLFMASFLPPLGLKKDEAYAMFEEYYLTEFSKLKAYTKPSSFVPQVVETALEKGYQIVLATNPLFPRLAIEERMRWASILDFPWLHITSYETSRFCKPNPRYFEDISTLLKLKPEECWMVGNDSQEDMVAGELGFRTYLVTDNLISKGNSYIKPDKTGTLREFLLFMQNDL